MAKVTRRQKPASSMRTSSDLPEPGPNRLYAEARLAPSAVVDRRRVTVNLAESPLGWLARRGMVTPRQFEAGERLRGDFTRAQLAPRTTMAWDAGPSGRGARGAPEGVDASTAQLSAKRRFEAAVTAVGGGLSDVLWRVVCSGEGLETAERALGWRDAKRSVFAAALTWGFRSAMAALLVAIAVKLGMSDLIAGRRAIWPV